MRRLSDIGIGSLAVQSNCSVPTIRYYEEIGLLPKAARSGNGRRTYGGTELRRLIVIRRCRDLGFSIEKIRVLLTLIDNPEQDCASARDLASAHLLDVAGKLRELHKLKRALKTVIADCNENCLGGSAGACVIFDDPAISQSSSAGAAESGRCCEPR